MDPQTLQNLPRVLQYYIIDYIPPILIPDKEQAYFTINVKAYQVVEINQNLQFHISCWFGVESPQNNGNIRYTIFERPFTRELERSFALIGNQVFNTIKTLDFSLNQFSKVNIFQGGKYGPLPLNSESVNGCTMSRCSDCLFHHEILRNQMLDYFKQHQVIDQNIWYLGKNATKNAIHLLVENTKRLIAESLKKYSQYEKYLNIMDGPIFMPNRNEMFYSLQKPFSDSQKIIRGNINREIMKSF